MKVKICGLTNLEDAVISERMGADALGFVHVPGRTRSLDLDAIRDICTSLGPMTTRLLVCEPSNLEEAIRMCDSSSTDGVQLYSLGPEETEQLMNSGYRVIRAVGVSREEALRFAPSSDAVLFEQGRPGSGSEYDYSRLPVSSVPKAIIAGGLNPDNLDRAMAMAPYALDVSSGVESVPGKKDPELLAEFIRRCRQ
jgi:phosphoribosylanthranilate isomerase